MKIHSMTGFGEANGAIELSPNSQCLIKVICKSVNHRFLDLSIRLPSRYSSQEYSLQKSIRTMLTRGRVEISVNREVIGQDPKLEINTQLLETALKKVSELKISGIKTEVLTQSALSVLLNRKEVLDVSQAEDTIEQEVQLLEKLVFEAINNLKESRLIEGQSLSSETNLIISEIGKRVKDIDNLTSSTPQVIKKRFEDRLQQLYANYSNDDQRMLQEIAVLSDKVDVREEIVRLKSHLELFTKSLIEGGRKLEFIVQEMGREINTIGSKTVQAEVSALVIEVKSFLERLREQLANIE